MPAGGRSRGAARLVDPPVDSGDFDSVLVSVVLGFALDAVDLQVHIHCHIVSPVEVKSRQQGIVASLQTS
jgi:hypothetical protein